MVMRTGVSNVLNESNAVMVLLTYSLNVHKAKYNLLFSFSWFWGEIWPGRDLCV